MTTWADVVVLGLGPAGRSTAVACAGAGLDVVALDPHPRRAWTHTYGAWADEVGDDVPVAARLDRPVAWTTRRHDLDRPYVVLDTPALQRSLDLGGVRVRQGRAVDVRRDGVACADGSVLRARLVLDARGAAVTGRVQQTAHGVVVDPDRAAAVLYGADGLFMDWRPAAGADQGPADPPSFLYALPLGGGRVLLEETCLAGRPALGTDELRRRLHGRLARHGVALRGDETTEHVRFALDTPLPGAEWCGRTPLAPRLGAAAPLVHPATGYSVAASLALAPRLARAATAEHDPARAVQDVLWPAGARAVHALRRRGLVVLLGLAPAQVPQFFAAFLDLPAHHQRAYLSERGDLVGTAAAMTALLPRLSPSLRVALLRGALSPGSGACARGGR